jgi:hypothetical protein
MGSFVDSFLHVPWRQGLLWWWGQTCWLGQLKWQGPAATVEPAMVAGLAELGEVERSDSQGGAAATEFSLAVGGASGRGCDQFHILSSHTSLLLLSHACLFLLIGRPSWPG